MGVGITALHADVFPTLTQIFNTIVDLLSNYDGWSSVGITYARIVMSLAGLFIVSSLLGLLAAWNLHVERFLLPLVELKQGIPALCWVLFAILWFADSEARIAFVVITSALPTFFYQSRDALRRIPRDWVGTGSLPAALSLAKGAHPLVASGAAVAAHGLTYQHRQRDPSHHHG